jgi:hypothetical protein
MRRSRIACLIPGAILAIMLGMMAGFELYSQSQGSTAENGSRILENMKNAAMTMRMLCSTEYQHQRDTQGFGTVIDLFSRDLIEANLADALGCPQMTSAKGKICPGTHAPLRGYLYRLEVVPSKAPEPAKFRIIGFPAVSKGEMQTGTCSFYVDQTGVIRASDDPSVEAGPQSPPLGTPQAPVIPL